MENLGKLFLAIILIVCGFMLSLLSTYIIVNISDLFEIPYLKDFTFIQILGLCLVIGIIKYKPKSKSEKSEDKKFTDSLLEGFFSLIDITFFYLLAWGITYLTYLIIK